MKEVNVGAGFSNQAAVTTTVASTGKNQGIAITQCAGKKAIPSDNSIPITSDLSQSLLTDKNKIEIVAPAKKKNLQTPNITTDKAGSQRALLTSLYTQLHALLEEKHITKDRFSLYNAALNNLKALLDRKIPETIAWPTLDEVPGYNALFRVRDYHSKEKEVEVIVNAAKNSPETKLLITIESWCLSNQHGTEIISKTFARNLLSCISPLSKNFIELAAGSAMLSAAINQLGGRSVLLTTDIKKPEMIWNDVNYKELSAECVVTSKKYLNKHMNITYLALNPTREMLKSLIDSSTPLFLVIIGCSYHDDLNTYDRSKLKTLPLYRIEGFNSLKQYEQPKICLFAINITDNDYQTMTGKIDEYYLTPPSEGH